MVKLRRIASFRVKPVQPYDFELTVRKPAGWHWFMPYEVWRGRKILTGFHFKTGSGKKILVGISAEMPGKDIVIEIYARRPLDENDVSRLRAHLVNALGAADDIRPLYALMKKNRILKHLARRLRGMHEGWGSDIFPSLTLAVLLQMAPIKRSEEMWRCLIEKYGEVIKFEGVPVRLWPTEEKITSVSRRELEKCKLGYRAKNLIRLSKQMVKGFPDAVELAKMSPDAAKEKLTGLYGIGEYSAGFATPHASFTLDVWSVKIFHRLIFGRPAPSKDPRSAIEKTGRAAECLWKDWRGYVFTYVLNDLPYLEKRFGITAD